MKSKRWALQAAVILGMTAYVCGCGTAQENGAKNQGVTLEAADETRGEDTGLQTKEEQAGENVEGGYCFVSQGVSIKVDMDMDELAPQLGEAKSVFDAPSCAGEGVSYIYNYSSYEIETYPAEDGKNLIGYIVLKDDMVATPEGIEVYMTRDDVIGAYGENYEEVGDSITYEEGGVKLKFVFDGDDIISIEYASAVIG